METRTKPITHIVILNDGKKGHLKQSLAIAENITFIGAGPVTSPSPLTHSRSGETPARRHPRQHIIFIHYKSKLHRCFLSLICFCPLNSLFSKFFLFLTLSKSSFHELSLLSCDIVISTGSSLNPVNILYASWKRCKNIVVMKPSWGRDSQYTLQIIPRHDNPKKRKNIIVTYGAPSIKINPKQEPVMPPLEHTPFKTVAQAERAWLLPEGHKSEAEHEAHTPAGACDAVSKRGVFQRGHSTRYLGILIGGNSKYHKITLLFIEEFIQKLKQLNLDFLITTSPRTPVEIDANIKEHFPRNYTPSIEKIFAFASTLIVTEDSISMISEALNSGKKVIVLEVPTTRNTFKHRRMIHSLVKEGYVIFSSIESFSEHINAAPSHASRVFEDRLVIQKAIESIL